MGKYSLYICALRKCASEHRNDETPTGHIIVSDLCRDTAMLLEEKQKENNYEQENTYENLNHFISGTYDY